MDLGIRLFFVISIVLGITLSIWEFGIDVYSLDWAKGVIMNNTISSLRTLSFRRKGFFYMTGGPKNKIECINNDMIISLLNGLILLIKINIPNFIIKEL